MCIVIAKPLGQKWPKKNYIQESANNNPDGFAMSWAYKGKLNRYTTMDKKQFINMYESLSSRLDCNEVAMLIHARIKTHGSVSQKNCHCWISGRMSFAHNGILSIKSRDDMTDSETFFRDIFLPIYKEGGWKAAEKAVNAVIGSSKFAFLEADGTIRWFGYKEEVDGCYYSNSSYKKQTWTTPSIGRGGYYGGYGSYGGYYGGYNYGGAKTWEMPKSLPKTAKEEAKKVVLQTQPTKSWWETHQHDDEYEELKDELWDDLYTDILGQTHILTAWKMYSENKTKYPHLTYLDYQNLYDEIKAEVLKDAEMATAKAAPF